MSDESDFDLMLARARGDESPPPGFLARVAAAGAAIQPAPEAVTAAIAQPRPASGFWAEIARAIGGWRGAGGLVTATLAGAWIGLADPGGLLMAAASAGTVELMPGTGDMFGTGDGAEAGG
ncbi:hypothetical protein OU426_05585 [Frigidibacter sp. RF13]|uniref:hypothetical protein n=1 Tax=Frigidibacter sp. RF13 TaxID=2997340 RepID=UPI00226E0D0D|nr:hypothetical protein [Frigidibacter sp. RF13]MCY1126322.1 hypothetical protein [Frigidibacter sp. RF13]